MRVRYGDEVLARLAGDAAYRPNSWEPEVVSSYRRRLQSLVAATGRGDLQRAISLDLRIENDNDDGARCSIRLNERLRLLLDFDGVDPDEVTVVGIVESCAREVAT